VVNFAIETKTEEYLGNAGLSRIDRQNNTAELGIILGNKEHWGKGYGSEAESMIITYGFRTLNLFKIFARIIERNKASIRAAEKAGMEQEAVLKKHFFREGKHLDVAVLSIFNS
jgi:RimJ/RimL family protein N-acetyltransferase